MKNITYREIDAESLQLLKPLCDALMKLQASRASKYREILASMNFDNRLAPSFESAGEKFCLAAFDGSQPVGYVFASTETVTEKSCTVRPGWAASFPPDSHWLYPDGLKLPCRIGHAHRAAFHDSCHAVAALAQGFKTSAGVCQQREQSRPALRKIRISQEF